MYKRVVVILFFLIPHFANASEENYLQARMELAKAEDYNPYPLQIMHLGFLQEHYKLASDPEKSIQEINEPLKQLSDIYPLGIQVNNAIADFLEYVADNSGDNVNTKSLLDVATKKRSKARAILSTILVSGDGKAPSSAYKVINIIEEDAVLEHFGFIKVSQSVIEVNSIPYDELVVNDKNGVKNKLYFDISLFYKD